MPAISWDRIGLWIWVGCLAVSLVCIALGVITLLLPARERTWLGRHARTILLLAAVAIFAVDSVAWAESLTGPAARFLLQVGLVVLGFRCHAWLGRLAHRAPRLASLVLLIGGVLLAGWLTWRLEQESERDDRSPSALTAMEDMYLETAAAGEGVRAFTDAGRPIYLRSTRAKVGGLDDVVAKAAALQGPLPNRVMVTAPMDATHNCYGWVFTGGRFFIARDDIEKIIADNQYAEVERPAAGDLILYRDDEGRSIHSGIVKAIGVDNFVLIESKWGWIGSRVLHPPDFQGYSQRYSYYRSARSGHLLRGLATHDTARKRA